MLRFTSPPPHVHRPSGHTGRASKVFGSADYIHMDRFIVYIVSQSADSYPFRGRAGRVMSNYLRLKFSWQEKNGVLDTG